MDEVKIFFTAEKSDFKVEEKEGKKGIKISGIAMPLNETSRNGVYYRPESVKKAYQTLKNASFLYNHNSDISIGHVEDVGINEKEITYTADLDPEEKKYISKVERGDIRHVSIGAMVANPNYKEDGTVEVDITEFVELSLVPVPGFKKATASKQGLEGALYLKEAFGELKKESEEETGESDEEETPEENKEETEETPEETPTEEPAVEENPEEIKEEPAKEESIEIKEEVKNEEEETEDSEETEDEESQIEKISISLKEQSAQIEELQNRLAILESRMDTYEETESKSESTEKIEVKEEEVILEGRKEVPTKQSKVIDLNERRLKNLSY